MLKLKERYQELYNALLNDKRDASPRFFAMQQAFLKMADQDLDEFTKLEENTSNLSRLLDFAKVYIDNHKGIHGTRKGRERYEWATQLRDLTQDIYNRKIKLLEGTVNEKKLFYERSLKKRPGDMDKLKTLAKLQRNIGTANFVPQVNDFQLKPTLWQRFTNSIGRTLSHLLNGLSFFSTGAVTLAVTAPFTTTGKYEDLANTKESDMDLVPGTKTGEHFETMKPEEGPDNQEICADTRRVPINYEELIPEDPDQPPTMTLCFEQGDEGKTKAMGSEKGQGHAFISLKYTKKNPLTGKNERYKCTFGFYPHQDISSNRVFAAMGSTGLVMPGGIENDNTHSYSTSATYQVTNKTINTVFQQAGQYAKGGYSYLSRSCATFAHDMAVCAGLPADQFFAKTDFQGKRSNLMKMGSLLGTQTVSRLGKHAMLKYADKTITEYERFGQRIVNQEDVKRLSKRKFNARLKGYVPSVAAEAARNNWDFHLGSYRYQPDLGKKAKVDDMPRWEYDKALILKEQLNLLTAACRFMRTVKIPKAERGEILTKLNAFMASNDKILETYCRKAFADDYLWTEQNLMPTDLQQMDAAKDATQAVKEYIQGLDQIFRTSFKSDPRVNISFQHMASTLQNLSQDLAGRYRAVRENTLRIRNSTDPYTELKACNYLGKNRDDFLPLARLKFYVSTVYDPKVSKTSAYSYKPAQIAGLVKSFGSLQEFLRSEKELDRVKAERGEKSKQYQKLKEIYDNKITLSTQFQYALQMLEAKKEFNKHDIDFIFGELPKGVGDASFATKQANPVEAYQSLVFARMFPDLRASLTEKITQVKKNFLEGSSKLEGFEGFRSPKENARKQAEFIYATRNQLSRAVFDYVAEKLSASPYMDTIINHMKADQYRQAGVAPDAPAEEKAGCDNMAFVTLSTMLCENLVKPMLEDVNRNMQLQGSQTMENEFSGILYDALNESKLEINEGARSLTNLVRGKLVEGSMYSDMEVQQQVELVKQNEYVERYSSILTEKKSRDQRALDDLGYISGKNMTKLKKAGKTSPQDPQAVRALAEDLTISIFSSTLRNASKGFPIEINSNMITHETERIDQYGAFADLVKPENAQLFHQAFTGSPEEQALAKSALKQKVSAAIKTIPKATKEKVDKQLDLKAHAVLNDPKAMGEDKPRLVRRSSLSIKAIQDPSLSGPK